MSAIDYLVGYDLFISYGHEDASEYATALELALDAVGISCFVDHKEMEPGAPLRASLIRAIRKSRALVILVSASSKTSDYVALEIAEFAKTGRPIIPILLMADRSIPWKSTQERNPIWIDERAEAWSGPPSERTVSGIKHSLKAVRRRSLATKLMLGVSAGLLALSLTVGFVALRWLHAAKVAHDQQELAEKRLRDVREATRNAEERRSQAIVEALSRQALARTQASDLSLLMAVEAVQRATRAKLPVLPVAEHALREAVARAGGIQLVGANHGQQVNVRNVAVFNGGRWLTLSINDGVHEYVDLFDTTTFAQSGARRLPAPGVIDEIQVSPDGQSIIAATTSGDIIGWDALSDWRPVSNQPLDSYLVKFSVNGRWLWRRRELYDLRRGTGNPLLRGRGRLYLSPDQSWIAESSMSGVLLRRVAALPGATAELAVVDDTLRGIDLTTDVLQNSTATVVQKANMLYGPNEISFSADSRWMLATTKGSKQFIWDLHKSTFPRIELSGDTNQLDRTNSYAFSPDNRFLALGGSMNGLAHVCYLRAEPPRIIPVSLPTDSPNENIDLPMTSVAFSSNGRWLALAMFDIYVYDLTIAEPFAKPRCVIRGSRDGAL